MTPTVTVSIVGAIPATIAAVAAFVGAKQGRQNHTVAKRIEHQTNGQLEEKIRKAVIAVFAEHRGEVTEAVMAESVRHLLNALINENQSEREP